MEKLQQIVKRTVQRCRQEKNPVTENLVSYVAQVILNEETNTFYLEEEEGDLEQIEELLYQKMSQKNSCQLSTIQMQISYEMFLQEQEQQKSKNISEQSKQIGELTDNIVNQKIKSLKDNEGLVQIYKKIYQFLIYSNKQIYFDLHNFETIDVNSSTFEKEIITGLESVIPRGALGPFVSLTASEKVTQLVELTNLVLGIRLFNKEIKKGGSSLLPISSLVNFQGRALNELIKQEIIQVNHLCDRFSAFLQSLNSQVMEEQQISLSELHSFKSQQIFLRQYFSLLLTIQEEIEVAENTIESNETQFNKEIEDLSNLLCNKTSAPKEQVYPKFSLLAQCYVQLIEEKLLFYQKNKLFKELQIIKDGCSIHLPNNLLQQLPEVIIDFQYEEIEKENNLFDVQQLHPQNQLNFMQLPLDFLGFCLHSLVEKDGLLVPGKPALGVFQYQGRNFVFANQKAARDFVKNPVHYLEELKNVVRRFPELIYLLNVEYLFSEIQISLQQQKEQFLSNKLMVDKNLQTPTHFVEKNIDSNYYWNEWELRKQAIQMANIRKRQTKCCQTIISNFKVDNSTHTYELVDKAINTGINKGTDPTRPRNYILGLRFQN